MLREFDCLALPRAQVWNTCANIKIIATNSTETDEALIPDGPTGIELPHF